MHKIIVLFKKKEKKEKKYIRFYAKISFIYSMFRKIGQPKRMASAT